MSAREHKRKILAQLMPRFLVELTRTPEGKRKVTIQSVGFSLPVLSAPAGMRSASAGARDHIPIGSGRSFPRLAGRWGKRRRQPLS